MAALTYNPRTQLVYRDGAVIGHVQSDKGGQFIYIEFSFTPVKGIASPDLRGVLAKVREHEETKGLAP